MQYDCAIIGGGLAGLSTSILLAKKGYKIILFEQRSYPMHKVCGEYISMESYPFLQRLGLDLDGYNLPIITKVNVSAPDGIMISQKLDLGGFGISRYKLEQELSKIAVNSGVELMENTKVFEVNFREDNFTIKAGSGEFNSKTCTGSYGKYAFNGKEKKSGSTNYIGVKYHILNNSIKSDEISLHNFKDGYCGISEIEDGKKCLCYLTTAQNLKNYQNSIEKMEQSILQINPFLKQIFIESEFLFDKPIVISNITFESKKPVVNNMLISGDAAGAIAPLCGNGMSMAFRSASISAELIADFLEGNINREQLNKNYEKSWNEHFGRRIKTGFYLQKLFGRNLLTSLTIRFLKRFPALTSRLIRLTHGDVF